MSATAEGVELLISGGAGAFAGGVLMFLRELLSRPRLLAEVQQSAQITATEAVERANKTLLNQISSQDQQIKALNALIVDLQMTARTERARTAEIEHRAAAHEVVLRKIVSAFNGRNQGHRTAAIDAAVQAVRDLDELDLRPPRPTADPAP